MPLPLPQGETVTILRPGDPIRDSAGNYLPGVDVEMPISGCAVWPTDTSERTDTQDQTLELLTVFLPYGFTVRATDRVRVHGRVFDIAGEAQPWRSPLTGTQAGIQIELRRTVG